MISELDEILGVSEGAEFIPSNRFKGSLDWIDELPTEPPLSIKSSFGNLGRDASAISNAITPFSVMDDTEALPRGSVLLTDNRRWRPDIDFDAGDIVSGASKLRADWIPYVDPDKPDRRYKVNTDTGEIKFVPHVHNTPSESRLRFDNPSRTTVCIRRKIRREILHALGIAGHFYIPRRFNPFSRVRC